jgi:hypothetical protein
MLVTESKQDFLFSVKKIHRRTSHQPATNLGVIPMSEMFCFQCEQTAGGKGCMRSGVCGKKADTADLQDKLTGGDPSNCVWELGNGMNVFIFNSACQMDGEEMEYACYNNVSEGSYIFRS